MRAAVYRGPNDLRVETVPVPRTGAGDLLVKVAACGVCPTDIKKIHYGTVPPPPSSSPRILRRTHSRFWSATKFSRND